MANTEHQALDLATLHGGKSFDRLPEVVVYQHRSWDGWAYRTNLNVLYVGDAMNDQISGIIVVSGTWRFFEHRDFQGQSWDLAPGFYEYVETFGIPNDRISSFCCIAA